MTCYCYSFFTDQNLERGRDTQAHQSWDEPIPLNARLKGNLCAIELNKSRYPHLLVLPIMLCLQHFRASLARVSKLFHIPHTNQLQSPKTPRSGPGDAINSITLAPCFQFVFFSLCPNTRQKQFEGEIDSSLQSQKFPSSPAGQIRLMVSIMYRRGILQQDGPGSRNKRCAETFKGSPSSTVAYLY